MSAKRVSWLAGVVVLLGMLGYLRDPAWLIGIESGFRPWERGADGTRSRWTGGHASFFVPSTRDGHSMFDLAGFIRMRLENAGVLMIDDIGVDTYSDERLYSYRRSVHRKEPDYGRHVHAIALEP